MAFTRASFDGDDAYYVVQALTAQQTDTLYRIDPNRGVSMPLDARHALALFPIWEAYVGTMCGIHATIMAHSVAPLLLIPLTYLIYYEFGSDGTLADVRECVDLHNGDLFPDAYLAGEVLCR